MQHIVSNTTHNQEADVASWPILDFETTRVYMCCTHKYIYKLLWKYIPLCGENTKYILCLFLCVQKYAGAQYLERRGERRDGKLIDRTIKEKQGSWRSVNILISIKRKYSVTFACAMRGLSSGFYFHQFPTQIWT